MKDVSTITEEEWKASIPPRIHRVTLSDGTVIEFTEEKIANAAARASEQKYAKGKVHDTDK